MHAIAVDLANRSLQGFYGPVGRSEVGRLVVGLYSGPRSFGFGRRGPRAQASTDGAKRALPAVGGRTVGIDQYDAAYVFRIVEINQR
jgi:hypothetical protein